MWIELVDTDSDRLLLADLPYYLARGHRVEMPDGRLYEISETQPVCPTWRFYQVGPRDHDREWGFRLYARLVPRGAPEPAPKPPPKLLRLVDATGGVLVDSHPPAGDRIPAIGEVYDFAERRYTVRSEPEERRIGVDVGECLPSMRLVSIVTADLIGPAPLPSSPPGKKGKPGRPVRAV